MTRLQQLFADLQRELVALGKLPATMTVGNLALSVNEKQIASVKAEYYAKMDAEQRAPR